mgnify:CR=1 FL=1
MITILLFAILIVLILILSFMITFGRRAFLALIMIDWLLRHTTDYKEDARARFETAYAVKLNSASYSVGLKKKRRR